VAVERELRRVEHAVERELRRVEHAMERLARVGRSRRGDALRAAAAGVHLPRAVQLVLRYVVERGPARLSDVARGVDMGDAAVSRHATALESLGLLVRQASPRDGRVALLRATPAGRRVQRRLREAQDEIFAAYLSGWSRPELARLAGLLERLADDLQRPMPEAPPAARAAAELPRR
jgi:DNA-binding MarR family transcriptional regulator